MCSAQIKKFDASNSKITKKMLSREALSVDGGEGASKGEAGWCQLIQLDKHVTRGLVGCVRL